MRGAYLGPAYAQDDIETRLTAAGARFTVLRKEGARLTRALMSYMLDLHTARGYEEIWPPAIIMRARPPIRLRSFSYGTGGKPSRPNTTLSVSTRSGAVSISVPSRSKTIVAAVI